MVLPIQPPPRSEDVAVRGWHALTVRIAWTLLSEGILLTKTALRDARTHVLFHIDPSTPLAHAEDLAEHRTREFVQRAKSRLYTESDPQDWAMPISSRWHSELTKSLNPLSRTVFLKHYGDGRSIQQLAQRLQVDTNTLEASRAGLREVVRGQAREDHVPLDGWDSARVDRLIHRLAAYSPGPCPSTFEVCSGGHPEHTKSCCRCSRMSRLVQRGMLKLEDLTAPSLGVRPNTELEILALHFHRDGLRHRDELIKALDVPKQPLGDDLLIIDASDFESISRTLIVAAELNTPGRDHIRGTRMRGFGQWRKGRLLGPLPAQAEQEARYRPWGIIDGIGELPQPMPEPPSARPVWLVDGVLALVTLLLFFPIVHAAPDTSATRFQPTFAEDESGIWVHMDVADTSTICVITEDAHGVHLRVAPDGPASKAKIALGDGTYRMYDVGEAVLVAQMTKPLPTFEHWINTTKQVSKLEQVEKALRTRFPNANIATYRKATP